jgi:hypothetical protein
MIERETIAWRKLFFSKKKEGIGPNEFILALLLAGNQ